MIQRLIVLAIALSAPGLCARAWDPPVTAKQDENLASFPMAGPGGRLIATVVAEDHAFLMEVDSGSICTFVDARLASLLGAKIDPPSSVPSRVKTDDINWYKPGAITIGKTAFTPEYVATSDLSSHGLGGDAPVLGVLGADFCAAFLIEIDNDRSIWHIRRAGATERANGFEVVDISRRFGNMPFLQVDVDDLHIDFLIDTGAALSIRLDPAAFERISKKSGLAPMSYPQVFSTPQGDISGGQLLKCQNVTFGRYAHPSILAVKGENPRQPSLLGRYFLARYNLICDFGNDRLYLTKSKRHHSRDVSDFDGVTLCSTGDSFVVTTVRKGSVGERSGLRPGDRVMSINGNRISDTDTLLSLLAVPRVENITLQVTRKSTSFEVTFPP